MPRQKLIIYFFAFLAALGLAMYWLLPAGSELRLLGIVLLIFCLPIALRYALKQMKQVKVPAPAPRKVEARLAFAAREVNLTVEGTFPHIVPTRLMRVSNGILDLPCLLAIGSDGFSTRLWRADNITGPWPNEEILVLNAEFLVPERALLHFPVGAIAQVFLGKIPVGSVKVLCNHVAENQASQVTG